MPELSGPALDTGETDGFLFPTIVPILLKIKCSMAKDPAFLFYPGDFTTGTQFFTDEQVGKYIRLLMAQHQLGHLEEKHMIMICKTYDKDVFSKFSKDSAGLYFNERLDFEIVKRKKYSESRSKNRSNEKNICKSYDEHMENRNRSKDINSINKESESEFLLIPKMLKTFTDSNPDYPTDKLKDSPALLDIAKFICEKAKQPFNVSDQDCINTVLSHWQHLCEHIPKHEFFKNYSIAQVSKHIQSIVLSIQNGKSNSKASAKSDAIAEYLSRSSETSTTGAAA